MRYDIADIIIPEAKERFRDWHPQVGVDPEPIIIFPAAHPEVGDVRIWDDGDEVRVEIGDIAHGHFGSYDEFLTKRQHAECITRAVVDFLDALFSDRIILWKGLGGIGGWREVPVKRSYDRRWLPIGHTYVWSKPLHRSPKGAD